MLTSGSQHNPARQQGYPPTQQLQPIHQRPNAPPQRSYSISQQSLPDTSQPAGQPATPASFTSPQLPGHASGSQHQAVYGQNSQQSAYYNSQPGIYGASSIVGNYQNSGEFFFFFPVARNRLAQATSAVSRCSPDAVAFPDKLNVREARIDDQRESR